MVAPLIIAGITDVSEEYIALIVSSHIAHLRQKCHNSKLGIFQLLVQKETFTDALLAGIV
jgi:hypothetical protein